MIQTTTDTLYHQANKKLFRSICFYSFCIVLIRLITNLFIATSWLPVIADILMGCTIVGLYFAAKDKEDLTVFFWPGIFLTQISFVLLWFGTGGVGGPVISFNLTLLVIYIALDVREQYWQIGITIILSTFFTILLEQMNPSWVVAYPSDNIVQVIDKCSVLIGLVTLIVLATRSMRRVYEEERKISSRKTKELALAKQSIEKHRDLLATLKELQSSFLLEQKLENSFDTLLKQLLSITESQYGFIGEVVSSDDGTFSLETFAAMDSGGMLKNSNLLEDDNWKEGGESKFQPLLNTILKEKTYILSDQVPNNQSKLTAFLGFPIVYDNAIVGMVGVANEVGYQDDLVQMLAPFLSTYGSIIKNIRLKRRQKKYEEELKKAKETAEQAVFAKNRLFTNISHEFRTPLSLIVGPVSAILKQPSGAWVEKDTRNSLNMVLRNSEKVLQYVDDIMDLAKLNSNKLEVWPQVNHLYSFIHGIYDTFKVQTTYRNIDYKLVYNVDQNLILEFDTSKMEKIINNLLSNAFKYTLDGGQIILSVVDAGDNINIEVRDTGIGIREEDLPHVFERFYQTKGAKKSNASGSGVGLALAQELAVLQGFKIGVTSILSEGTAFTFSMPRIQVDNIDAVVAIQEEEMLTKPLVGAQEEQLVEGQKEIVSAAVDTGKPTILIVEDNRDMAAFVKLVLGTSYAVELAENGAVGLKILEKDPARFDLVITDLMMPEMDGYELLKHIKAKSWGGDLPVIVLTAKSSEASKLKALTIGVDEYLTKPFSVDELTIHVKNLIENSKTRKTWKNKEEAEASESISNHATDDVTASTSTRAAKESILHREKIERAREVVLENIDETEFAVDDLAKALAVSKRQLYRFMQSYTGLTPLKFINEIRLQEARRLLEDGACSTVKEVSYSIGFMSTRHFSKNYSTRFGKKPSEYFR
ncbi:response regulator [Aureispira anguillae]|uniref:histidine kinase n=1 Tax=Aureispira anguillae TaxID=2864201 RepID=A0A915YHW0_9BACT|nr:response regulator [Aureispira anguillae]BDS13487.1 response regulator [Aureispira anguillae]